LTFDGSSPVVHDTSRNSLAALSPTTGELRMSAGLWSSDGASPRLFSDGVNVWTYNTGTGFIHKLNLRSY
jgi:hypothetical protein